MSERAGKAWAERDRLGVVGVAVMVGLFLGLGWALFNRLPTLSDRAAHPLLYPDGFFYDTIPTLLSSVTALACWAVCSFVLAHLVRRLRGPRSAMAVWTLATSLALFILGAFVEELSSAMVVEWLHPHDHPSDGFVPWLWRMFAYSWTYRWPQASYWPGFPGLFSATKLGFGLALLLPVAVLIAWKRGLRLSGMMRALLVVATLLGGAAVVRLARRPQPKDYVQRLPLVATFPQRDPFSDDPALLRHIRMKELPERWIYAPQEHVLLSTAATRPAPYFITDELRWGGATFRREVENLCHLTLYHQRLDGMTWARMDLREATTSVRGFSEPLFLHYDVRAQIVFVRSATRTVDAVRLRGWRGTRRDAPPTDDVLDERIEHEHVSWRSVASSLAPPWPTVALAWLGLIVAWAMQRRTHLATATQPLDGGVYRAANIAEEAREAAAQAVRLQRARVFERDVASLSVLVMTNLPLWVAAWAGLVVG